MRPVSSLRLIRAYWLWLLVAAVPLIVIAFLIANWAYENDPRVRFHVQALWADLRGLVIEEPEFAPTPVIMAAAPTFGPTQAPTQAPTPTATPSAVPSLAATATAAPSATPEPSPTALPPSVALTGFKHEYQLLNNCGPASLAINLSYWGWGGDQRQAASVLKPNQDDKNVSPRELYEYALTQGYDAYIRVNGDVETLKRFIAAGYPVVVEKGFTCVEGERCSGWFGHYSTFTGYDDARQVFIMQDSFRGPNITMTYEDVMTNWRAFNYLYVVLFPAGPKHDAKVVSLLGEAADLTANYQAALARAQRETQDSTGQQAAFAWFNVGTNLYYLQDYAGAAAAFDQARQIGLPYRMLWYQFGPYQAYYFQQRYQDVIDLATFAIRSVTTVPGLEEAYYWRGLSVLAQGDRAAAEEDFRTALERHPGYAPAIDALSQMGLAP